MSEQKDRSPEEMESVKRVLSGESWRNFCQRLADAGEVVLRPDVPDTPLDRAEGFRYLSRLLRIGLMQFLEAADTDSPFFYRSCDEISKWGADNPDNIYWNARVRGDRDYRITGTRGSVHYLGLMALQQGAGGGTSPFSGALQGSDMAIGPDGKFEIIVSAKEHSGNWLRTTAATNTIIVRQTFLDRRTEIPGTFHIEQVGGTRTPAPLDPIFLDTAFRNTADFVHGTAVRFTKDWNGPYMEKPNQIWIRDQSYFKAMGGDPTLHYMIAYFDLQPDEAWVIDVTPPDCPMWNFTAYNWWNESLDYVHRPVTVNKHTAKYNPDNSVTIVVAGRDAGLGNWIDTAGHKEGPVMFRWFSAKTIPLPKTRVVKLAEITQGRG
jgi:hypothetical protein